VPDVEPPRPRRRRQHIWLNGLISISLHALALGAVLHSQFKAPAPPEPEPMTISLVPPFVEPPPPPPPPPPKPVAEAPTPAPAAPMIQKNIFRKTPNPPPDMRVEAAGDDDKPKAGIVLSDADIAGAATSGTGSAGGECNMQQFLESKLRNDRSVQAAIADSGATSAMMVWNGDWVRHPGQEGEGLAQLREAMMWEIAFAPEACRKQPVRGLVLLSLNDSAAGRIVLGSGHWRWSDLLFARGGSARPRS
jgi:hypothetical protein